MMIQIPFRSSVMNADRILRARLRRWWYLLSCGMWNGERGYDEYHLGRTTLVAASTGSLRDDSLKITRTFYREHVPESDQARSGVVEGYYYLARTEDPFKRGWLACQVLKVTDGHVLYHISAYTGMHMPSAVFRGGEKSCSIKRFRREFDVATGSVKNNQFEAIGLVWRPIRQGQQV